MLKRKKRKKEKNYLQRFGTHENLLPLLKETRKIFNVIPNLHKSLHFYFESILLIRLDKTELILLKIISNISAA